MPARSPSADSVRILALLPETSRRALEHALQPGQLLSWASDAAAAGLAVRNRQFDALVLDPGTLGDDEFEELVPILGQRVVPVVLYTSLTPANARRIVRAAEIGAHELVLRDVEDAVPLLAHRLRCLVELSPPALLLNRVARRLHRFPDPLRTVSVGLFASGPLPRWVDGLSDATGLARRSIDRWMQRAGIGGAATLLDAARLARVWEPVVDDRLSMAATAHRCGYARSRLLVAHARRLVGVAPAEFGLSLTREKFVLRLTKRLLLH